MSNCDTEVMVLCEVVPRIFKHKRESGASNLSAAMVEMGQAGCGVVLTCCTEVIFACLFYCAHKFKLVIMQLVM